MSWKHNTAHSQHKSATLALSQCCFPASRHAVNPGSEDQRVAHILTSSDKAWLTLMCLQEKHPPRSFNVSLQDALCQFSCMCSALSLQNMHAGSNGWERKERLRRWQASPEVMNFVQSSESVVSSKYLLINRKKFSFYCVTESVVRPQRERASRPTFPETGDFVLIETASHVMEELSERVHSSDSKQTAHPASVVIHRLSFQHWFINLKRSGGVIDFVYWNWILCGLEASAIFSCRYFSIGSVFVKVILFTFEASARVPRLFSF